MTRCPCPGCDREVQGDGFCCTEHYFALPQKEARSLLRLHISAKRERDPDNRAHLISQNHGYVASAFRRLLERNKEVSSVS